MKAYNFQIKLSSFHPRLLQLYSGFLKNYLENKNLRFSCISMIRKDNMITLLKSPHVHKKAKQQFLKTTYTHLINLNCSKSEYQRLAVPFFVKLSRLVRLKVYIKEITKPSSVKKYLIQE